MVRLPKRFRRQTPLSIIFVIDLPGHDEWSIPLLCSLKLYAPKEAALIAYVPDWKLPLITPSVRILMDQIGVDVRTFDPSEGERLFATDYAIGNKILACREARRSERAIFLDTDIFLNEPLDVEAFFGSHNIAVCPAEFNSFSNKPTDWQGIYQLFGLDLPAKSMVASRSKKDMFPYYNAGVIGFSETSGFSEMWADTAAKIDHADLGIDKRPWLDQIAFPVALARMNITPRHLEANWNFALNGMKVGRDLEPGVKLAHFHLVRFLKFKNSYARIREILDAVLGPTKLHEIAERALEERATILAKLPVAETNKFERAVLENAQELSERRRGQLVGF